MGDSATLGRVLAFCLNGNRVAAEDVQMAFGISLLEELAAFGGGRDGIEHASFSDPRFGMVGNKLVTVRGDPDTWITSSSFH